MTRQRRTGRRQFGGTPAWLNVFFGACLGAAFVWSGVWLKTLSDRQPVTWHGQQVGEEIRVITPESGEALTAAVKKVAPAVVNIDTIVHEAPYLVVPDLFDFFFGGPREMQPPPRKGQASGIIADAANGYVVTNAHVVKDSTQIRVVLPNRHSFAGQLVGSDVYSDVAVVRVKADNLPSAQFASSKDLAIGSWAIAIGNPLGFSNTVTVGVISATGRDLPSPEGPLLKDLVQTDAAINPGNSGGALCNIEGKVIGMNTAIIPQAEGIGFAIGADTVSRMSAELIRFGRVRRPWLGVGTAPITEEIEQYLGVPDRTGVVVVRVMSGSPAEALGLQPGDVLREAGGKPLKAPDDLREATERTGIGGKLTLTIWRQGQTQKATVKLGEMPGPAH